MRRKPKQWKQDEKDFILANYKSMTIADMARELGCSYRQVDGYLYSHDLYKDRKTIKRKQLVVLKALKNNLVAKVYLAALVDGEGTITIQKRNMNFRPCLQVANTSVELLAWLISIGFYSTLARNSNGRPYWRIQVSGYGIVDILEEILPYLIIKKKHAELTIEFINIRGLE